MAKKLLGKDVAQHMQETLEEKIAALEARGVTPTLALVRVGARGDDMAYERSAIKRMDALGIRVRQVILDADASQQALETAVAALSDDPDVHGVMIFQPLPAPLSAEPLKAILDPRKDVDGMSPVNMAKVFSGDPSAMAPCTPQAVIEILDDYGIDLIGKRVTVVGRSMVVGRPLAMLLLERHATVTICHTKTDALMARCREAEVLVAACGRANMIGADMVGDGAIVIDVGINVGADGKLCGDVDFAAVEPVASAITPVPGGVGSVTTSVLAKHVVEAAAVLNGVTIDT
ncbi:MAG: bifunctional 5,10-methylenetetrahydrofolate dehydrogenase/5,10-methenyltetrahydrofolate cyclohydrolase [Peptococcaceae bacterium]|nr:bifunctional 5,10-methylenetetrahydrofolate dehydrogenase/5,10-methenyltetrahydrofolate cyclohydrolase [Peptococcaceae bacterium]